MSQLHLMKCFDIFLHFFTASILNFTCCRKIPIEGSEVTSSLWGPFDEFLVTGHKNGSMCHYDVTRVSVLFMMLLLGECVPRQNSLM